MCSHLPQFKGGANTKWLRRESIIIYESRYLKYFLLYFTYTYRDYNEEYANVFEIAKFITIAFRII